MERLAQHDDRRRLEIYLLDWTEGQFACLSTANKSNCNGRSRSGANQPAP
jgi:hypothetical protein